MLRFNSINFYPNNPKRKLFLPQKYKISKRCRAPPADSLNSPPLQISGYVPDLECTLKKRLVFQKQCFHVLFPVIITNEVPVAVTIL